MTAKTGARLLTLSTILLVALVAFLMGCQPELSPVPQSPTFDLVVDAQQVPVETAIRVNGYMVTRLSAYGMTRISVKRSLLQDGPCVIVSAHITGGATYRSGRECLGRDNTQFAVQIVPRSNYIFVTPR